MRILVTEVLINVHRLNYVKYTEIYHVLNNVRYREIVAQKLIIN